MLMGVSLLNACVSLESVAAAPSGCLCSFEQACPLRRFRVRQLYRRRWSAWSDRHLQRGFLADVIERCGAMMRKGGRREQHEADDSCKDGHHAAGARRDLV